MRIPEVADRLRALGVERGDDELICLAEELRRRRPTRKAPPKSTTVTPALQAEMRAVAKANPSMTQVEIGRRFNVNQGRVSEALRGFRT